MLKLLQPTQTAQLFDLLVSELTEFVIVLIGRNGRFSTWNPAVERHFGYAREEWIGEEACIVFTPEDIAAGVPEQEIRTAVRNGRAPDVRWHCRKDGSRIFVEGVLIALKDDSGDIVQFAKVMRDVTERKENEDRLNELTQALKQPQVIIRTLEGRIQFWSYGAERLYGWSEQEAIGKISHHFLKTEFPEPLESINEKLQKNCHWQGELAHRCKDGGRVFVKSDWILQRRSEREPSIVVEANTDVTELRLSEERFRLMADSLPQIVWVTDAQGSAEFFNRQWTEYTGLPFNPPVNAGEIAEDFVHPDDREITMENFNRARETGTTFEVEHRIRSAEGSYRWFLVRAEPQRNPDTGEIVRWFGSSTDIHQRKQEENERRRAEAELARSNEELQQFANVVSHDLQAPIRMVKSYAQLLSRRYADRLDQTAGEFIRTITDGAELMEQLTRSILELAQIGEAEGERTPIPVDAVIDGVLASLQPEMQSTGAKVICGDMPTIVADRVQILQLFQNLIANAIKYRHPKRPPLIQITAERKRSEFLFKVSDNGIGIEPQHRNRIFVPLKRLHGKEIPGAGIGLAVCRKVIERQGGRIWVESEPGNGSTFCFTWPTASTATAETEEHSQTGTHSSLHEPG